MKAVVRLVTVTLGLVFLASLACGQTDNPPTKKEQKVYEKHQSYYDVDKFNELAGDDGVITEADWVNNRTAREGKFFGDKRWDEALKFDANGDGALDQREAKAFKQAEERAMRTHREGLEQRYKKWRSGDGDAEVAPAPDGAADAPADGVPNKVTGKKDLLDKHPAKVQKALEHSGKAKDAIAHREKAKDLVQNHGKDKDLAGLRVKGPHVGKNADDDADGVGGKLKRLGK